MIATISDDRTVRFWQPAVGRLLRFAKLDSIPRSLNWSPDAAMNYVGGDDGQVRAISFDDAGAQPPIAALSGAVPELRHGPDSKNLLTAGYGVIHVAQPPER